MVLGARDLFSLMMLYGKILSGLLTTYRPQSDKKRVSKGLSKNKTWLSKG
jgi:hypothetical protein